LFAAIVIASFAIFSSKIKENEARLCGGIAHNASEELAACIDGATASGAPLAKAIEEDPGLWKSGIAAMAGEILDARPYVIGVSVAPSAIVKYHFPEEGSESLVGHDLLSNPERRDALTAAVERKAPVLSGPDESVDGGRVLFIRYPVFAAGKLWGFTSLTIDFERMLESLAFEKRFPGFSFALSDKDFIAGTRKAFSGSKVASVVKLPGTEWTLHVIPSAGWSSLDPFLLVLLLAGLAGSVLLFIALRRKPEPSVSTASESAPEGLRARAQAAATRAKETRDISAFDIAVREAGQLSASRERPWLADAAGSFVQPNGASPIEAVAAAAPAVSLAQGQVEGLAAAQAAIKTATQAAASGAASLPEAAGFSGTGLLQAAVRQDDVQNSTDDETTAIEFGAKPAEAKEQREVRFIGPAVRGEVYMPERLISGEPGSLFARFAVVEKAEAPAEAKVAASEVKPTAMPAAASAAAPAAGAETRAPVAAPFAAPAAGSAVRAPAAAPAATAERVQRPAPDLPPVLKNQKEFPFSVEVSASAKADNAAKADSAAKSLAILVVDDSEANREIMGRMLALRGFQADFAVSGEESIERCSRRAYDIVFMDCFMPGMDGYKASAALRQSFGSRVGAIVGMSARIGDQELERCRQAGMDDLLAKPFSLKQLLAHLEKL
jgi:CheY-like chemotaxis protein/sensor domain CHASE-containing protein